MPHFRYNYDGFLKPETMDSIRDLARRYGFPVEMSNMPGHDELQALFTDRSHRVTGEGCMGEPTSSIRDGIAYGWISRDFMGGATDGFLMLPDLEAHTRVVAGFPDLVVKAQPFTSTF